jgi:hypothetical protein
LPIIFFFKEEKKSTNTHVFILEEKAQIGKIEKVTTTGAAEREKINDLWILWIANTKMEEDSGEISNEN